MAVESVLNAPREASSSSTYLNLLLATARWVEVSEYE
jgi:hypothetical protein